MQSAHLAKLQGLADEKTQVDDKQSVEISRLDNTILEQAERLQALEAAMEESQREGNSQSAALKRGVLAWRVLISLSVVLLLILWTAR
jgi:hypothetical protein